MKIRIERFELELPDLVENILDFKLKGDLSSDQLRSDMYRTACTAILEMVGKAFAPTERPPTQADLFEQMLQPKVQKRAGCPNCGGVLIVTGDSAIGLYKCVRCYVPRSSRVDDGEVVGDVGVDASGASEEPPPAGVGG